MALRVRPCDPAVGRVFNLPDVRLNTASLNNRHPSRFRRNGRHRRLIASEDPLHNRARQQLQLLRLRNRRPALQRVVTNGFDRVQDGEPAAAEHFDVHAQRRIDTLGQRHTLFEQFPRPRDEFLHQRNIPRVEAARHDVVLREAVRRQRFERNIDAALVQVAAGVLPEIRELERGAGRIGKPLALGIAVPAKVEHQTSHGISRIAAVSEHAVPRGVTMHRLVLPKRHEQIRKRLDRNVARAYGLPQRNENRMRRLARITVPQFPVPTVQQLQGARGVGDLISKVVRPAAVRIQIVKMLMESLGKQPRGHIEIFVVVCGEPARVAFGLRKRTARRRHAAGNFEFNGNLHGVGPAAGTSGAAWKSPRGENGYGITATFISPLRCFMCSNIFGSSVSGISAFTKSHERISPRAMASRASRMKRGVWWNVDLIVISE